MEDKCGAKKLTPAEVIARYGKKIQIGTLGNWRSKGESGHTRRAEQIAYARAALNRDKPPAS